MYKIKRNGKTLKAQFGSEKTATQFAQIMADNELKAGISFDIFKVKYIGDAHKA
jgi:hypothetical protein